MLDETALDSFIDDLLAERPTVGTDDPAAETIAGLARFGALSPPAAGRAKARQMMLARARELQKAPVVSRWRQKLSAIIAAATAMTMLSGGAVYASSGTAPGDLLYPVKRTAENVSITFKPPGRARAQAKLDLARIRLAEIKILIARGETERIGALVRELNGNLKAAGSWRSRLTAAERQRIETEGRKVILRKAAPRPLVKSRTPETIEPQQAPMVRPALRRPTTEAGYPRAPVKPARPSNNPNRRVK